MPPKKRSKSRARAVVVMQSPEDKRLYRHITLPNGLVALLISDPDMGLAQDEDMEDADSGSDGSGEEEEEEEDEDEEMEDGSADDREEDEEGAEGGAGKKADGHGGGTKKAACAMAVGVGSFSDPVHGQGLSHFLEHMVFMGSERFPVENAYDAYLAENGGSSNAYTEAELTCFHFDIQPAALRGALERFSSQFVAPLCLESATDREVCAVHSEFEQVLQSDSVRLLQVQCHTSAEGHPYRKFSWGNKKSLVEDVEKAAGEPLRSLLLKHHKEHYRADRMTLVLLGPEDLDTLEAWTKELFGPVPGGGGPRPSIKAAGFPFPSGGAPVLFRVPAVKELHEITVTFTLPPAEEAYESKPEEYVSHLIGHESSGSLLSALKARGLASGLCAGVSEGGHERSTAAWLFGVGITLTDSGVARWTEAIDLLFAYVAMIRAAGPQKWIFEELSAIKEMEFRFAEEEDASDYCTRLSAKAHHYDPEHVLVGDWLLTKFEPAAIAATMDLFTPRNCRIDFLSHSFDLDALVAAGATRATEPWFNVPFCYQTVSPELLARWEKPEPSPLLALPPKNEYIPRDFSLRGPAAAAAKAAAKAAAAGEPVAAPEGAADPPALLSATDRARVWHKLDTRFLQPRASVFIAVTSPRASQPSPTADALTQLALKILEDALAETSYLADVAGLRSHVNPSGDRFEVKVDGFNEKVPLLAQRVFASLTALPEALAADRDRFGRVREAFEKRFRNALIKPLKHATYLRLVALRERVWTNAPLLEAVKGATEEAVVAHLKDILSASHVEVLAMGNMTADEAAALAATVAGYATPPAGLPAAAWPTERIVRLPPGAVVVSQLGKNAAEENSVVENYYQVGMSADSTAAEKASADLLDQIFSEPCFDTLRTKEQLGYTVSSGVRLTHGVLGFVVVVQSSRHAPLHVDARVESFLEGFDTTLSGLSAVEFEKHRAALIAMKMQKDRTHADEADRHWETIWNLQYDFNRREKEVEALRALTHAQIVEWYREHLMPRALRRRKLSVQIWSHATATAAGMKETDFVSTEALEARMTLAEKHKQPPPHPASVLVVSKELRLLIRDLPFLSQSLDAQELKLKAWPGFFAPQSVLNPVPGKKQ